MHSFLISVARCHPNVANGSVCVVELTQTEENNFHLTMDVICDDWTSYEWCVLACLKDTTQQARTALHVVHLRELACSSVKSSPCLSPQGQGPHFSFINCWLIAVSNKQVKKVLPCTDDVRLTLNSTKYTFRTGLALWDVEYLWYTLVKQ